MASLIPPFTTRLSEADLAARARYLLERCRRLGATDPTAARRTLRRQGRLVQPAFAGDEALQAELVQVLYELRRGCGELGGRRPTVVAVPWEEIGSLADLAGRTGGSEALVVRCAGGDLVSEAEAVCALAEGPQVVLALVGDGPPMVVRSSFVEGARALLQPELPARELPLALEGAATRLGFEVRRW